MRAAASRASARMQQPTPQTSALTQQQPRRSGAAGRVPPHPLERRRQHRVSATQPDPSSQGSQPAGGSTAPAPSQDSGGASLEKILELLLGLDNKVQGLDDKVQGLDDKVQGLDDKVQEGFAAQGKQIAALNKQARAVAETVGGVAEKTVQMHRHLKEDDIKLRQNVDIRTGDDLLHFCSLDGFNASKEDLLHGLVNGQAVFMLFVVVARMMQEEATSLQAQLPAVPGPAPALPDVQQWLAEARKVLLRQRGKGRGLAAWLPACKQLEALANAGGQSANSTTRLFDYLAEEEQGSLVLKLLAAWATDKLYEVVEMDGEPLWKAAPAPDGVHLSLLEIKTNPADVSVGVMQLEAQAHIMLLGLALANAAVLQHCGSTVRVTGIVTVIGRKVRPGQKEAWERRRLEVGGKGPAPKAKLQVRIQS